GGLASLSALHGRAPGSNGDAALLLRLPAPLVDAVARRRAPLALAEITPSGDGADRASLALLEGVGTSLFVPLDSGARCQAIVGDSYDFLPMGRRTLGIALADVCGKGLPAALLLASAQAHLRGRAAETASPGALLARLNDELVAMRQPEKFVCLAFARLDAQR